MYFISLNYKETKFVLKNTYTNETMEFEGTVSGAIELLEETRKHEHVSMSSDLNHPNEFPNFAEHAIDIAAGYIEGALEAGVIELVKEETNEDEGTDY